MSKIKPSPPCMPGFLSLGMTLFLSQLPLLPLHDPNAVPPCPRFASAVDLPMVVSRLSSSKPQ